MLAAQSFSAVCLFLWGLIATYPIIWLVNKLIPIRLSAADEIAGCDVIEHYMGDETDKMLPPLDAVQIANINRFDSPHVNFRMC